MNGPPNQISHRMVICLTISPPFPVTPPSRDATDAAPGFFSNIFQNFKLSSAAMKSQLKTLKVLDILRLKTYLLLPASDHLDLNMSEVPWFRVLVSPRCVPVSDSSIYSKSCLEIRSS